MFLLNIFCDNKVKNNSKDISDMKNIFNQNLESKETSDYFENYDMNEFKAIKDEEEQFYETIPNFENEKIRDRGFLLFHSLFSKFQNVQWTQTGIKIAEKKLIIKMPFSKDSIFGKYIFSTLFHI